MFGNLDFGPKFWKILILLEIFENPDFVRNFRKISVQVEICKKKKISILVEILENVDVVFANFD